MIIITLLRVLLPAISLLPGVMAEGTAIDLTGTAGQSVVIVAAGCFWSVELAFQRLPGVTKTRVGYVGGNLENPTYSDVVSGRTGHAEAVEVTFDSSIVSLGQVLDYFFLIHEPTTVNRQGNDVGTQYRSAIWYSQETDEETVFEAKDRAQKRLGSSQKVVTEIDLLRTGAKRFWDAEDYHQQYLEKGGQSSTKGKLDPIRCYGNRGPWKKFDKPEIRNIFHGIAKGAESMHEEL